MISVNITSPIADAIAASILALTPRERWSAARDYNSVMTERWFIVVGLGSIVLLTAVLIGVTYNRRRQEKKSSDKLFDQYSKRRGLSRPERQILHEIAAKAGLKRDESIFTLSSAFDRGAGLMMKEQLTGRESPEEIKEMRMELSFVCEKLGFKNRPLYSAGTDGTDVSELNSRQIPVGKEVQMTRRRGRAGEIAATIAHNTDSELGVRLSKRVKIIFGESWCIRYYFGSSVWEFDTSVVSYDGNVLVLKHSESVRFINRRRFLRVPVQRRAYISSFPFAAQVTQPGVESGAMASHDSHDNSDIAGVWGPPQFIPAAVTELAGPGLRIESALEAKPGDRVLVVFNINEELTPDPAAATIPHGITSPKVVQNVGEVKHARAVGDAWSIAVELTCVNDSDVGDLIKATNAAAVSAKARAAEAEQMYNMPPAAFAIEEGTENV